MQYQYKTSQLVCSQVIEIEIDDTDGTLKRVNFIGGCPGNLAGIAKLVTGMRPEDVVAKLKGITCGGKPTSCPDQLAYALNEIAKLRNQDTPPAPQKQ
ncbi:MAG: TIGR03905 family TSCPD domain-containing protein [Victivallaceae bacterium]|nr:TIGR03905 family TSCPD domain-containing protein [Victivallaceae bacterium]